MVKGKQKKKNTKQKQPTLRRVFQFSLKVHGVLTLLPISWHKHKASVDCGAECSFFGAEKCHVVEHPLLLADLKLCVTL